MASRPGFTTITPYLIVDNVDPLVEFVTTVFGATEIYRSIGSAGGNHIEMKLGDSMLMLGGGGAWQGDPATATLYLYLEDVDGIYQKALAAGATTLNAPANTDFGERMAGFKDPFGNTWYVGNVIS